jgi:2-phospho-L-lactate transferase/gluconeogenesis factor (CofD/UPF0052 family)
MRTTPGVVVQVINIMTEAGETDGFDAWDHVDTLRRHVGRLPDLVVVNATPIDGERLEAYREEGAEVVGFDPAPFRSAGVAVAAWPLLAAGPHAQHDADAVARELATWWKRRRRR